MTVVSIATKHKNLPRSYRKYYEKGAKILKDRENARKVQIRTAMTVGLSLVGCLAVLFLALFL